MKRVVVGSDHGAFQLKERIKKYLEDKGYEVTDTGVLEEKSVDYPDMAESACLKYLEGGFEFGILCCGTGIGISIAANKVDGIRCGLIHDLFTAEKCKAHNNVNFIAFGGRLDYGNVTVEEMIDKYIETEFEGDRHQKRIDKITALE